VGDCHELGDSWSAEDGVVGSLKVLNLELDVLGALSLVSLKVTGRTTEPSGIVALPGTMP
jgi:hypothetical protein